MSKPLTQISHAEAPEMVYQGQRGTVTRLTKHSSHHLYFTNEGVVGEGRYLLYVSDILGVPNLARLNLQTGDQQLLTTVNDYRFAQGELTVCADATNNQAYCLFDGVVVRIDLEDGIMRPLSALPDGLTTAMINLAADGSAIYFVAHAERDPNMGFDDFFESKPTSRLYRVDTGTGVLEQLFEAPVWMGHCNTSPTDPALLTFCHEGPWTRVEHRVWRYHIPSGEAVPVGPAPTEKACVGHEYWLADGSGMAFHGYDDEAKPCLGIIDAYTHDWIRWPQATKSKHTHSIDGQTFVGDGDTEFPNLWLWKREGDDLGEAIPLATHGGGWSIQRVHPHPRFTPDGNSVIFTSDVGGSPRVYRFDFT